MEELFKFTLAAVIMIFLLAFMLPVISSSSSNQSSVNLNNIIGQSVTNGKVLVAVIIQFILGLALGYYSAKVIKYMLALIGILVLGAVLSVWSLGGSVDEFVARLGYQAQAAIPMIKGFLATLGILTVGPVTIGFLIGLLLAITKK